MLTKKRCHNIAHEYWEAFKIYRSSFSIPLNALFLHCCKCIWEVIQVYLKLFGFFTEKKKIICILLWSMVISSYSLKSAMSINEAKADKSNKKMAVLCVENTLFHLLLL